MAAALGRNARQAAASHYSWTRHVANVWMFAAGATFSSEISPDLRRKPKLRTAAGAEEGHTTTAGALVVERPEIVPTGDAYKDQVQRQWNNDPAGSHYVVEAPAHTKEWFLEAERHRYELVRAMDAGNDGIQSPRRRGAARDRRRDGDRSGSVCSPRGARHRSGSVIGTPDAGKRELRHARPAGTVHSAGCRDARFRGQHVRRRLQQRRAPSHAEHALRGSPRFCES